jgi:polysaccharide export outer membrane protein
VREGVLLLLVGFIPLLCWSQVTPNSAAPSESLALRAYSRAAVLQAGDTLELKVFGVPEMTQEVSVNNAGQLDLPWVGLVQVAGMTVEEARLAIAQKLREKDLINEPHVTLTAKSVAGQTVSVLGEVTKPGTYPPMSSRLLVDQISAAGGTTPRASKTVLVTHRGDLAPIKVRLDLESAAASAPAMEVAPGDTIVVPRAGVVYVVGDVNRAAGLVMDNDTMTVLQAIALAGGVSSTASLNKTRILRRTAQSIEEIPVPLKPMLSAKAKDVELQPNDVLFVPGSKSKVLARRSSEVVVGVATGAALVWRP